MKRTIMNLGFGVFIIREDVIGIYDVDGATTMKRMTSKTNSPFPNQVLNNLNGRGCKSYVETPFHIYLCAYPVEVLLEEYLNEHTDEVGKIRDYIDSEEYLHDVENNKYAKYKAMYADKIEAAKKKMYEAAKLQAVTSGRRNL